MHWGNYRIRCKIYENKSDETEGTGMKASEAQLRAQAKYDKANTRDIKFKFNLKTDADILEKLDSVPNKQGYVKDLIRTDIAKSKRKQKSKETL